jgi:hypothetical protein
MLGRIRSIIARRITKLSETSDAYEAIYRRTQQAGDSDDFRALASTIRPLRLIVAATQTDPDAPSVPAPPGSSTSSATSSPHLGARPFPGERRGKRQRQIAARIAAAAYRSLAAGADIPFAEAGIAQC